jgi:hypothetical protein
MSIIFVLSFYSEIKNGVMCDVWSFTIKDQLSGTLWLQKDTSVLVTEELQYISGTLVSGASC